MCWARYLGAHDASGSDIDAGEIRLRKARPVDLAFAQALDGTLNEWRWTRSREPTVTFEACAVVVVPFPFTDRATSNLRLARVLSNAQLFNARLGKPS